MGKNAMIIRTGRKKDLVTSVAQRRVSSKLAFSANITKRLDRFVLVLTRRARGHRSIRCALILRFAHFLNAVLDLDRHVPRVQMVPLVIRARKIIIARVMRAHRAEITTPCMATARQQLPA